MLIGLFVGVLVALGIFIAWDSRRMRRPLSRDRMRAGFVPGAALRWKAFAGFALLTAILGIAEVVHPSAPPFTGKIGFLFAAAHNNLGALGPAIVWLTFTVIFAGVAYAEFRKQTPIKAQFRK